MNKKDFVLNAMTEAGESLNAGKIAELTDLNRKIVDQTTAAMKKDGSIVSPVRCKWEPAE
ncbi:MAG: transcriptional regulator [Ruminococcus sp.]|nr:transcriptional regulator [Ruminococcus sp.]